MRRPGHEVRDLDIVRAALVLEGHDVAAALAACEALLREQPLTGPKRRLAHEAAEAIDHALSALLVLEIRCGTVVRFTASGA